MRILAWDIGIKNLSYCLYDTLKDNIIDWNIVDISQNGKEIFNPTERPFASAAPRLAASIIPGPPPLQTINLFSSKGKFIDHSVSLLDNSTASS